MRRGLALMFAAAGLSVAACGQSPGGGAAASSGGRSSVPVVVDVVVRDPDGRPVQGLKAQNFRVMDGGVAQTVGRVEAHSGDTRNVAAAGSPRVVPGIFTNFTPIAPGTTLNILLVDALNTPVKDKALIRRELQDYVDRANADTRIAVFGLANRLILLQGFTSDPAVLRGVVERKLIERSSATLLPGSGLANASASMAAPTSNGSPSAIEIAANLREFQTQMGALETGLRAQYTLDAFNTLGHYLAGFAGRKNLIWVSGSFPLGLLPDPAAKHPAEEASLDATELRQTVGLLSKARVAVYPVDARRLMREEAVGAALHGSAERNGSPRRSEVELGKAKQTEAAEKATMEDLAMSTGGRVIDDGDGLAAAVNSAVAAGADYYTLVYTAASAKEEGGYHSVRVETVGVDAGQTLQVLYRRGYYDGEASPVLKAGEKADPFAPSAEEGRAAAYRQAAMSRGAPAPEDILFKARVVPASASTETVVAADNQLSLAVPANGPFRRYAIDYLSLAGEMAFLQQADGRRVAKVEFLAYDYDTEGRLLNSTGQVISIAATTSDLTKLAHSVVRCHLELSAPDRAETFLRIGMRDVATNRFGVIEVPASSLSSLPPASESPAVPGGRTTPPKD